MVRKCKLLQRLLGGLSYSSPGDYLSGLYSRDFLLLSPISEIRIWKALKGFITNTSVTLGGINGFIMKAYCILLYLHRCLNVFWFLAHDGITFQINGIKC
jgi:hypothetical protein